MHEYAHVSAGMPPFIIESMYMNTHAYIYIYACLNEHKYRFTAMQAYM